MIKANTKPNELRMETMLKEVNVQSHNDLLQKIAEEDKAYVLLYKEGSELSECARENIRKAADDKEDITLHMVNVAYVRDIHPVYGITSVPTLLTFEKGEFKNTFKGCNNAGYYKTIFENLITATAGTATEGKPQKRVVVYSTPGCPWCNTLKNYLRSHHIPFRDIDVSRDQHAAEDLVRKTGQQGVPQTEINGQWVIGFDQKKIDQLLDIEN